MATDNLFRNRRAGKFAVCCVFFVFAIALEVGTGRAHSAAPQAGQPTAPVTADLLFTHARLLDGSGNPWRWADVALRGDRIIFVGDAQRANVVAQQTLDLHGLYLAPGFIDLHTHTGGGLSNPRMKENLNYLLQGVTTVATGNDGNSPWPIGQTLDNWEKNGIGTNAALYVGFGTVRRQVLRPGEPGSSGSGAAADSSREDRAPTAAELAREQELVR